MMIRWIKVRSLVALILFGSGCSYDINTVDPQSSVSIADSKRDGLFVCQFSAEGCQGTISNVIEAWGEHVWFNEPSFNRRKKRRIEEVQLDLNLAVFKDSRFKREEYLVNWLMKDNKDQVLGQSNGVYVLPLDNKQIPDTIRISICTLGENREATCICQFTLKKAL